MKSSPVNSAKRIKVLCVGEEPKRAAPTRTLAHALHQYDFEVFFSHGAEKHSTWRFLRLAFRSDLIVCVTYNGPKEFVVRRLALATMLGRPLIRWWVGTDVWTCLAKEEVCHLARMLDRFVALNIAAAPHLVQELSSIGIKARFLPMAVAPSGIGIVSNGSEFRKSMLVYLPFRRKDFYGEPLMRRVIETNPDIEFVVVADDTHALASYPNVRSLGWVEDMSSILSSVGGLLRITKHDGLPRMVLECLLLGKYVIYSWPFPACWLAKTFEELQQRIDQYREVKEINSEGIKAAQELLTPDPGLMFANSIRHVMGQSKFSRRLRAALTTVYLTGRL